MSPPEHNPPGLISSVLGYISREVQDFVSTATGATVGEVSSTICPRYVVSAWFLFFAELGTGSTIETMSKRRPPLEYTD
ncbi:hypothetical protein BV25DRAFT_1819688 [Artomyces pyxidatus]|uniref:Uncharacterized protein n=1 Tax=Artomyces pyxidatus TaxID=48021 RepID=A0ACB8TG01_9AGAM|nr:hypothetical protein BV25DRAFT_1819688 [Artomyces pyxidatus]